MFKKCRECGKRDGHIHKIKMKKGFLRRPEYYVMCHNCGRVTPFSKKKSVAKNDWKRGVFTYKRIFPESPLDQDINILFGDANKRKL